MYCYKKKNVIFLFCLLSQVLQSFRSSKLPYLTAFVKTFYFSKSTLFKYKMQNLEINVSTKVRIESCYSTACTLKVSGYAPEEMLTNSSVLDEFSSILSGNMTFC